MALEWLKPILGDGYTEEIDKAVSEQIGKGFVARADFNELKESKKSTDAQLAEANKTIESLQAADKDIEAVRKEAADYSKMMQKIVFTSKRWNSENGRNKKKSPDMVIRSDNAPIYKELLEGRTKATNRKKLVAFVLHISR